MKANKWKPYRV